MTLEEEISMGKGQVYKSHMDRKVSGDSQQKERILFALPYTTQRIDWNGKAETLFFA